ncbi:MAG: hypothetical protein HUJ31_15910, partial [Pseudomonadales bacterium]|nr:hypothetical protein [Pseudomonadales bacterium]
MSGYDLRWLDTRITIMADVSTLPSLEDNRYLRFATFAILYMAQGLPWGMFVTAIPACLAGQGVSAAEHGAF